MKSNFKLFSTAVLLLMLAFSQAYSATAPTIQARYVSFANVATTTARVAWINGNGAKRIVAVSTNPAIDWNAVGAALNAAPHNTTEFADADGDWTNREQIGATNAYVVDVVVGSSRVSNLTNLVGNSAYSFAIFEYNVGGVPNVAYNVTASINNPHTLETAILAPDNLASTNPTENSAQVSWEDTNIPQATSYRLDVSTSNTFATFVHQNLNVAASPYTIVGLDPETTYYFRLRAVSGVKISSNSEVGSFKTGSTPPVLGLCW